MGKENCKKCKYYEEWEHFISGCGTSVIHKCKSRMNEGLIPIMNEPFTILDINKPCEKYEESR